MDEFADHPTSFEQAERLTGQMLDDFEELEIASSIGQFGWVGFGADIWKIAQLDPGVAMQISEPLLENARAHHRTGMLCKARPLAMFVGLCARGAALGALALQEQTPIVPDELMRPKLMRQFTTVDDEAFRVQILSSTHLFNSNFNSNYLHYPTHFLHPINPPHPKTLGFSELLDLASIQLLGYWSKRDIALLDEAIDPHLFSTVPLPKHLCENPGEFEEVARGIERAYLGLVPDYEAFKSTRKAKAHRL